jgi:CheY-like chemotaxis protein
MVMVQRPFQRWRAEVAEDSPAILLADPDADTRCMYAALMRHVGWRVYQTYDADTAYLIARRLHPDVVACELRMQLSTGSELCMALAHDPETTDICTVVVTARLLSTEDAIRLSMGRTHVVSKPCTPRELLQLIERLRCETRVRS